MVKVHVYIKHPLILLSQFEDPQNCIVHIAEPWRLVPTRTHTQTHKHTLCLAVTCITALYQKQNSQCFSHFFHLIKSLAYSRCSTFVIVCFNVGKQQLDINALCHLSSYTLHRDVHIRLVSVLCNTQRQSRFVFWHGKRYRMEAFAASLKPVKPNWFILLNSV